VDPVPPFPVGESPDPPEPPQAAIQIKPRMATETGRKRALEEERDIGDCSSRGRGKSVVQPMSRQVHLRLVAALHPDGARPRNTNIACNIRVSTRNPPLGKQK
jgi:hypothetical protein